MPYRPSTQPTNNHQQQGLTSSRHRPHYAIVDIYYMALKPLRTETQFSAQCWRTQTKDISWPLSHLTLPGKSYRL